MRDSLITDARTIAHLSQYWTELRRTAIELAERIPIAERKYFLPDEEDRVRRLQISYWQSRAALLELIEGLRHDDSLSEEEYPAAFLVAFAAALLLVDAARFLREQFHTLAPVRRKLDEPALEFGIPPLMYDTVQKSLTSPRHAWHLYHAHRYYEEQRSEFAALASVVPFDQPARIVEELAYRLDIPLATYAAARLRVRGGRAARRVRTNLFGRALYGIQKLGGILAADVYVRRGHRPALPAHLHRTLGEALQPGDIFIVRKEHALTNYFLPGYWPHAALYLGSGQLITELGIAEHENVHPRWKLLDSADGNEPRRVLEAQKDGVHIRSIASPLASDSIVVLRPQLEREALGTALARGLAHEGKPYDFDFDFERSDRLVCTEVIYRTYDGMGDIQMRLTRRAGRFTLAAGDLIRLALADEGFSPLLVYSPADSPDILVNEAARHVLRQREGAIPSA
ncbi:MAG: hypothetical protein KDA42_09135 [Planctomycetales bacterium]|nr:hypothetical protein [Planctomycetales bacterium]